MLLIAIGIAVASWCPCSSDPALESMKKSANEINKYFEKRGDLPYRPLKGREKIKFEKLLTRTKATYDTAIIESWDLTQYCFSEATAKVALLAAQNDDVNLLLGISSSHPAEYLYLINGNVDIGTMQINGYRAMADMTVLHSFLNDLDQFSTLNTELSSEFRPLLYKLVLTTNTAAAFFLIKQDRFRNNILDLMKMSRSTIYQDLIQLQIKYQLLNPIDNELFEKLKAMSNNVQHWDRFNSLSLLENANEQYETHSNIIDYILNSKGVVSTGSDIFNVQKFVICAAIRTNNTIDLNTILSKKDMYNLSNDVLLSGLLYSLKDANNNLISVFETQVETNVLQIRYYGNLLLYLVEYEATVRLLLNNRLIPFFIDIERNQSTKNELIKTVATLKQKIPWSRGSAVKENYISQTQFKLILMTILVIKCALKVASNEGFIQLATQYIQKLEENYDSIPSNRDQMIIKTKSLEVAIDALLL